MPTAKRARQKAARQQKRAVEQKRAKRRKLGRTAAFVGIGGAVILVIALATAGVFSSSSPPSKAASKDKSKSTTTTTAAATTTTTAATTTTTAAGATTTTAPASTTSTTFVAADAAADQAAANAAATAAGCPATPKTRVNTQKYTAAPPLTITKTKTYTALIKTTVGTITISLLAKTAPNTVNSFVFLADKGYFNCVVFSRVVPGFMNQTGDPTGTDSGGPGYEFANENLPKSYVTGDVAMANSGANTNGSQFFIIATGGGPQLSSDYSLFGKVTAGLTVAALINSEGNSATNGIPPKVIQRMLTVTITTS